MGKMDVNSPVFILGAGRSGTTLLSRIVERSPAVFNGYEFRYIWNYRTPHRNLDLRPSESDKSPAVRYIREYFSDLAQRHGRIIIDKTPSNAWRIPFIRTVFPDARFIHILRDGRANIVSRYREWHGIRKDANSPLTSGGDRESALLTLQKRLQLFRARQRIGAYPTRRLPAVVADNLWPIIARLVLGRPVRFGERTPGLDEIRRTRGVLVAAASQWRDTTSEALFQGRALPLRDYMELRFEDLTRDAGKEIQRIFKFLELPGSDEAIQYAQNNLRPGTADAWRASLTSAQLAEIEPIVRPVMEFIGYQWD